MYQDHPHVTWDALTLGLQVIKGHGFSDFSVRREGGCGSKQRDALLNKSLDRTCEEFLKWRQCRALKLNAGA